MKIQRQFSVVVFVIFMKIRKIPQSNIFCIFTTLVYGDHCFCTPSETLKRCSLFDVPGLVAFEGFVPLVAAVSLVQYVDAGVSVHSLAVSPRGSVPPERCWIDTRRGVLLQFVSRV